jgi:hypothetical protein
MMTLKRILLLSALVAAVTAACARTDEQAQRIARGKYIVESVGLCADCHTPHNERGEFIKEKWLQGSELVFAPTVPMPWAPAAPRIAGLPRLSETEVTSLLETGATPSGWKPRPPCRPFGCRTKTPLQSLLI